MLSTVYYNKRMDKSSSQDLLSEGLCELIKLNINQRELKIIFSKLGASEDDYERFGNLISKTIKEVREHSTDTGKKSTPQKTSKNAIQKTFIEKVSNALSLASEKKFELQIPEVTVDLWSLEKLSIDELTKRLKDLFKAAVDINTLNRINRFETGMAFIFIKGKIPDTKEFEKYVNEQFDINLRTVQRYIRYAIILHQYPVMFYADTTMTLF